LAQYAEQQQGIQNLRDQLKGILAEALTAKDGGNAGNAGAISSNPEGENA